MKVGIIGYGFVGKALAAGIKKNVDILKIDPNYFFLSSSVTSKRRLFSLLAQIGYY